MKKTYTIKETAEILSVSKQTVYNMISTGKINPTKLGPRLTRIQDSEINKLLTSKSETIL